jgi:glycosyltransferase involved in cell wall biosynthesis
VSVVLAVFNGERYVRQAMESLFAQTFRDFEIVVIDDGSTDGTPGILRGYDDSRVRIVRNERNLGLIASLNRGLREAAGEYVARIDADDPSHPERFAKQVDFLDRHPEVALVGTLGRCIDDTGRQFMHGPDRRPTGHDDIWESLLQKNTFLHSSVMYRREVVQALGGYDPTARHAEDYALWLLIAERHRVANIPEQLVDYRVHGQQVSRRHIRIQRRVADRLRHEAWRRRRAAGLLPSDERSPLPSLRDRLSGRLRTLGGDYVYWIDLYRQMGREDLARDMILPGLLAAPLNEFLRDELLARYLTAAQIDMLRRRWRRLRAILRSG